MRCISKRTGALVCLMTALLCTGCSSEALVKDYKAADATGVWKSEDSAQRMKGMAQDLCVVNEDVMPEGVSMTAQALGLFDIADKEVLVASNVHEKMYPASITKIMTALLFLENYQGDMSEIVTVSKNATITESGAQLCGYKTGDQVTLEQLLNGLLIYSGNDAAMILAEYTAGSVDEFMNRMNQRAVQLGATNTHFVNPHGLHDDEHYTTAYDLYLIFQEVMKYDVFREIINKSSYEGEYTLADGKTKKVSWKTTNLFLSGDKQSPEGVAVLGGKTGTTNAAGSCLILLSQDAGGADYISIILRDENKDSLYTDMATLLGQLT